MANWLDPADIERLASDPARRMQMPALDRIDFSRPFVPEDVHAALLHAGLPRPASRAPAALQPAVRRAHQRIHHDARGRPGGAAARRRSRRHRNVAGNAALVRCLDTMIEEEKRALSLLRRAQPRLLPRHLPEPRALFLQAAMAGAGAVRHGRAGGGPACLRALVPDGDGGILDRARARHDAAIRSPRRSDRWSRPSRRLHREHLKDEVRHLQIDGILVELCLDRTSRTRRVLNAALFKSMLGTVTRPTRAGSGVKVIRELVRQMPELSWREQDMIERCWRSRTTAPSRRACSIARRCR